MQAIEAGMAAYAFTSASPAMPIGGGREPFLGTSPFAFGTPGGDRPVILDMALSVVARGKIRRAASKGEPIPIGRSEEHTSELQSLMRISYAVFCLKKKKRNSITSQTTRHNICADVE